MCNDIFRLVQDAFDSLACRCKVQEGVRKLPVLVATPMIPQYGGDATLISMLDVDFMLSL